MGIYRLPPIKGNIRDLLLPYRFKFASGGFWATDPIAPTVAYGGPFYVLFDQVEDPPIFLAGKKDITHKIIGSQAKFENTIAFPSTTWER
jgi:hypothetical protein